MLNKFMREDSSIQYHCNELKVRLDLNKFAFTINGACIQRTDKIEKIKYLERRLIKKKSVFQERKRIQITVKRIRQRYKKYSIRLIISTLIILISVYGK